MKVGIILNEFDIFTFLHSSAVTELMVSFASHLKLKIIKTLGLYYFLRLTPLFANVITEEQEM